MAPTKDEANRKDVRARQILRAAGQTPLPTWAQAITADDIVLAKRVLAMQEYFPPKPATEKKWDEKWEDSTRSLPTVLRYFREYCKDKLVVMEKLHATGVAALGKPVDVETEQQAKKQQQMSPEPGPDRQQAEQQQMSPEPGRHQVLLDEVRRTDAERKRADVEEWTRLNSEAVQTAGAAEAEERAKHCDAKRTLLELVRQMKLERVREEREG